MVIVLLLAGCTTLSTLEGARTLEPGTVQAGGALSLQRGANPISYAGIPIPQLEAYGRYGVAPDLDIGARLYFVGAGMDVRYRFLHRHRLHMAVVPGLDTFWLPIGGTAAGQGSAAFRMPITAELELSDRWSVAGGPRIILRNQWNSLQWDGVGRGTRGRVDAHLGGGLRLQLALQHLVVGASTDLHVQPLRRGGPSYATGIDLGVRTGGRAARETDPDPGTSDRASGSEGSAVPPPAHLEDSTGERLP